MSIKNVTYQSALLFVGVLCLAVGVGVGIYNTNVSYPQLHWLPISFGIYSFFLVRPIQKLKQYFVFYVILFQQLIRYFVAPILLIVDDDITIGLISFSGDVAVVMMILELIVVLLIFILVPIKSKFRSEIRLLPRNLITISMLIVFWLILFLNADFLERVNFIWDFQKYVELKSKGDLESASPVISILFPVIRAVTFLLILSQILTLKIKQRTKFLISLGVIALNATLILGTSRFSVVYSTLPLVLILAYVFPLYQKKITSITFIMLFGVLVVSSITKFSRGDEKKDVSSFLSFYQMNAYFSGVANYAVGIDTYEMSNVKPGEHSKYMLADLTQNIPAISAISRDEYKSNIKFNHQIYGVYGSRDQIVPISIAGLFHFSYYFFFVYSLILTVLAFKFERIAYSTSGSVLLFFFYITLAFSCATFMMINIGSVSATLFMHLLIFIPVFKFVDKLNFLR